MSMEGADSENPEWQEVNGRWGMFTFRDEDGKVASRVPVPRFTIISDEVIAESDAEDLQVEVDAEVVNDLRAEFDEMFERMQDADVIAGTDRAFHADPSDFNEIVSRAQRRKPQDTIPE